MSNVIYGTKSLSDAQKQAIGDVRYHPSTFVITVGSDHPLSVGNSVLYIFSYSEPKSCSGHCEYVASCKSYVIRIKLMEDGLPMTVDRVVELIAHETYHMVSHLFEWIKIPMVAGDEAGAYTLDYYLGHAFRGYLAHVSKIANSMSPKTEECDSIQSIVYPTILDWEDVRSDARS